MNRYVNILYNVIINDLIPRPSSIDCLIICPAFADHLGYLGKLVFGSLQLCEHFTSGCGASSAFFIKFWNNLILLMIELNWKYQLSFLKRYWSSLDHHRIKIWWKLDQNNLFEASILGIISFQRKMSSQGDEVLHLKLLLKSRRKMIHHVNFDLIYCKKSLTSFWFTVDIVSLEISGFNLGNTFHKNLELSQKKLKIGPKYTRNCDTQMLF